MTQDRIHYLLDRYINKTSSWEELKELAKYTEDPGNKAAIEAYMDGKSVDTVGILSANDVDWNNMYNNIIGSKVVDMPAQKKVRKLRWRVGVAAAVFVFLVSGFWFLVRETSDVRSETAAQNMDVEAPKGTRAMITLADGRTVPVDSLGNLRQGNVTVMNENGQIVYQTTGQVSPNGGDLEGAFNILYNPRGSNVIKLTLSDGTKVWLNSESSLKYPTAFSGSTRDVEITGEAYFEVSHNASKPFHVKKGGMDVTVLGTHFNVNAYDDEDALRVTLLEGSVQVSAKLPGVLSSPVTIKPGQQAVVADRVTTHHVDSDATVAWVNNHFQFDDTDVKTMMRQIARWYDVDVEYKGKVTRSFGGKIPRTMSAKNVFRVLEETGGVHFRIEGRRVIVMP